MCKDLLSLKIDDTGSIRLFEELMTGIEFGHYTIAPLHFLFGMKYLLF